MPKIPQYSSDIRYNVYILPLAPILVKYKKYTDTFSSFFWTHFSILRLRDAVILCQFHMISLYIKKASKHIHLFHPNFRFVVKIPISNETGFIFHSKTWYSLLYIVRVLQLVKSCTVSTEKKVINQESSVKIKISFLKIVASFIDHRTNLHLNLKF